MKNETKKSKKRLQYEAEYRKKGLNEADAAMQAYKRERMEKILKISAGVAVAALAGYGAYKYRNYAVDKVLKGNVLLTRISPIENSGVEDSFFASLKKNRMDTNKYLGLYNKELKLKGFDNDQYEKIIRIGKETKIASPKNARKALADMIQNDPEMKEKVKTQMEYIFLAKPGLVAKATRDLDKGIVSKRVYDVFNISMTGNRDTKVSKAYFDKLKSLGYGGIADMNDLKYSGYKAKLPVIVFDTSAASVEKMRKIGGLEENARYALAMADLGAKAAAKGLGVYGGVKAYQGMKRSKQDTSRNNRIVARYRKEHPNSELSYRDIVRAYEDAQKKKR